jgi:hypothetical protein
MTTVHLKSTFAHSRAKNSERRKAMKIFTVTVKVKFDFNSSENCAELVVVSDTEADVQRQIVDFYSNMVGSTAISALAEECGPIGMPYFTDDPLAARVSSFRFKWKR